MGKQCIAINLSNRKQCKRTDTTEYTHPITERVYDWVCTKHIEMVKEGKAVNFTVEGHAPRSHYAILDNNEERTIINLKSGEMSHQQKLEKEMKEMHKVNLSWVDNRSGKYFRYVKQESKEVASFREAINYLVNSEIPEGTIGFLIAKGEDIFMVSLDGEQWKPVNQAVIRRSNNASIPGVKVEKKGVVCGNCTTWKDGQKVHVYHADTAAVRACYEGQQVPAIQ